MPFAPIAVRSRCIALAETRPDTGAAEVARELSLACAAAGHPAFVALCERPEDAGFVSAELARLGSTVQSWVRASVQGEADLRALLHRAEQEAPQAPWLFLGDAAVLGLSGALKLVLDRPGTPSTLAPRARALKAAAHLILTAHRTGLATQLAQGWLLPTAAP